MRGPNIFPGTGSDPDATRESFTDDWFHTGDIGAWDDDGYLTIVGRAKELIISGGFNVYPREVEDVLLQHPSVREVAVIGTPSDEWGETVTAVVVADGVRRDERALLEFAAEQLASFKRPRIVRYVDELPRNALGKVVRSELALVGEELADVGEALDRGEGVGLVVGELADDDVGEARRRRTHADGRRPLGVAVRARLGREPAVPGADHRLRDACGVLGRRAHVHVAPDRDRGRVTRRARRTARR